MPLDTTTIALADELDRYDDRLNTLADRVADSDDTDALEEAQRIESQFIPGLQWALSEWDDPSVTLGTLNTGEMGQIRDLTNDLAEEKRRFGGDGGAVDGAATPVFIAAGVIDAPFVPTDEHGQPQNDLETLYPVVASELLPQFSAWLEHRINDLTRVDEGNVRPFAERVKARKSTRE